MLTRNPGLISRYFVAVYFLSCKRVSVPCPGDAAAGGQNSSVVDMHCQANPRVLCMRLLSKEEADPHHGASLSVPPPSRGLRFAPTNRGAFSHQIIGRIRLIKHFIAKLAQTAFVRRAITDRADLSALKERPTPRIVIGVVLIALSYILGWPVIVLLGGLSIYLKEPLLVVIGGPVFYGLSHLILFLGMYLAGMHYSWILLRWMTRITMVRLMKKNNIPMPSHHQDG